MIGGVILCLIPGPGVPLLILGAALLAERSRVMAKALDWLELKLRKVIAWAKAWWKQAPLSARFTVILVVTVVLATAGYGAYAITFGR